MQDVGSDLEKINLFPRSRPVQADIDALKEALNNHAAKLQELRKNDANLLENIYVLMDRCSRLEIKTGLEPASYHSDSEKST